MQDPMVMSDAELKKSTDEAVNPELSDDFVTLGYDDQAKRLQAKFLNLRKQQRITKLLSPHLKSIGKLFDGEGNGIDLIANLADPLADVIPEAVSVAYDVDLNWLLDNSDIEQCIPAIKAQLKKMRNTQFLGELLRLGAQKGSKK